VEIGGDDVAGALHRGCRKNGTPAPIRRDRGPCGPGARTDRTTRTCFADARHRATVSKGGAVKSERHSSVAALPSSNTRTSRSRVQIRGQTHAGRRVSATVARTIDKNAYRWQSPARPHGSSNACAAGLPQKQPRRPATPLPERPFTALFDF
jgi:hypothetical protein